MIGAIVHTHALLQVVWVSLVAGVGVTSSYGLAILGGTRAVEFSRDGQVGPAVLYAVVGVAGIAVFLGAIVFGIVILMGD
ncbi:MAG: hypothetical protein QOE69_391 [Thermoleophilaceae bacterium]|jgi:hypothetical protein|nr:hypothetical protein [Thermoleophilaceae bacterium]